jgi:hypothetical protein
MIRQDDGVKPLIKRKMYIGADYKFSAYQSHQTAEK